MAKLVQSLQNFFSNTKVYRILTQNSYNKWNQETTLPSSTLSLKKNSDIRNEQAAHDQKD